MSLQLAAAGFLATAVTYGPARMGYGLFLPVFRDAFDLSTELAGAVASAAFLGFLVALPLANVLLSRRGPRLPVVIGGVLAASGFALVCLSTDVRMLAAGVVIAASSAGFSWAPYNNAARRLVPQGRHAPVLSAVSTGTTFGVAGAALLSLLVIFQGYSWRAAWASFALAGVALTVVNLAALRDVAGSAGPAPRADAGSTASTRLRDLLRVEAFPLYAAAACAGATNAAYLSFAVDRVASAGGLAGIPGASAGPVLFVSYGVLGAVGLATGSLERRFGQSRLLAAVFACFALSLVLIGIAPTSWVAVVLSAGLQGACVMLSSAIFSLWSLRLFPALASTSFTAALLAHAAGSVIAPGLSGFAAARFGLGTVFVALAGLPLLAAFACRLRPPRRSVESA